MSAPDEQGAQVGNRWPELAVSGLLVALGALVVADSLRVGIGWADDGPRSGYFPFYIGLLLAGSGGSVFVRQLLRWRADRAVFATREQLTLVVAVLVPMLVYVGLIFLAGLYIASALLVGWFMKRYGRYGLTATVVVSLAVSVSCFLVFERWFLVPLPKGPIEQLLGL